MTPSIRSPRRLLVLASIGVGILLPLLVAELALRLLPVTRGIQAATVEVGAPIFRFQPNDEFVWSRDWDLIMTNRGRINNAGFVNDQDYDPDAPLPLLAVIGDSYVEAIMVPFAETLHGRLAARIAGRGRVYSFAASGAPLSQYLAWADHARETYRPAGLVMVVVSNDFDESLAKYKTGPGFHLYNQQASGELVLRRTDYRPNPWLRLLLRSALMRYAVYHLKVQYFLPRAFGFAALAAGRPATGGGSLAGTERIADSRRAVQAFFRDLPVKSGLRPSQILFVVDGLRYPAEDPAARAGQETGYFARMRDYFLCQARGHGYGAIDMDTAFFAHWRQHGERFDWPRDGHWNPLGHRLAAEQVERSGLLRNIFDDN